MAALFIADTHDLRLVQNFNPCGCIDVVQELRDNTSNQLLARKTVSVNRRKCSIGCETVDKRQRRSLKATAEEYANANAFAKAFLAGKITIPTN